MDKEKRQLKITDMDLLGRGIGRYDGKAVFVPNTVAGDTVLYEIEASKKRYDIGRLCEVISPSEHRIKPECSSFGDCGGCSFLGITRELETTIKSRAVEAAFRRAGIKVTVDKLLAGNNKHYRNKAVFHLDDNGRYGFYTTASHMCTHVDECMLVPPIFNDIISFSEKYFLENNSESAPVDIMLRIGNGEVMLTAAVERFDQCRTYLNSVISEFPNIGSVYECIGYPTSYDAKFKHFYGKENIQTDFCGIKLNISPKSFFQVNIEIAELLCCEIADMISPADGDTILDLYCGIGTIGLTVASKYPSAQVIGIEINESAVADAKENSRISDISNAGFFCCDAGRTDLSNIFPGAVIVDPPRFGLTDSMISSILKIKPKTLIYMSCNPSTLAGDSTKLISGGYSVSKCIAADMFPGCPHIETLVSFVKD